MMVRRRGLSSNFRFPYHAKVLKTFEAMSSKTVAMAGESVSMKAVTDGNTTFRNIHYPLDVQLSTLILEI